MGTRRRLGMVLAGALVLIGLGAGACAKSSPTASNGTTDVSSAGRANITAPVNGKPVSGGKLVYGIEAETDGFDPSRSRWAISGSLMANAVFDPIAAYDANSNVQPYLAQKIEHSPDYRSWTLTMRPGVSFHNGQPANADAGIKFIKAIKDSSLTGPAAKPVQNVSKVDDLTVKIDMDRPWAAFPVALTGQAGMIPAPEQLDRAAAGDPRGAAEPIGTGPFKFKEWVKNQHFNATRNPSYWRQGLPYLDEVQFNPVPDVPTRINGLLDGSLSVTHADQENQLAQLRQLADEGKLQYLAGQGEDEESFVMLNNQEAPLSDRTLRQALAYATDISQVAAVTGAPEALYADSPWTKDSPWYTDPGYPKHDVTKATQLVDQWKSAHGGQSPEFTMGTTTVQENQQIAQLLQQQWQQVGFKVNLQSVEQTAFILQAVTADYQAVLFRQFSAPDPDGEYHWWISDNAAAKGTLGLNFARIKNPDLDAALNDGRSNPDQNARKQDYAKVAKLFATEVPYVWLTHVRWGIAADNRVHDLLNGPLPDGQAALPALAGVHRLAHTWIGQ